MDLKKFYGSDNNTVITFLEFGGIDIAKGSKAVWDFRMHQTAYDWFMLGRYANDLLAYQAMLKKLDAGMEEVLSIYNTEVHHPNDASTNLSKLIALSVAPEKSWTSTFFELGQTLFGCIDGMLFYQEMLKKLNIVEADTADLESTTWHGFDISDMFNRLAKLMHQSYNIVASDNMAALPDLYDVFFAKGVTLHYAMRDIDQFFTTINKGRCSVFDYSFAIGDEQDTPIGTGKNIRYLSYTNFQEALKKQNKVMYVKRQNSHFNAGTQRVWLDCLWAEDSLCKNYIQKDRTLREQLHQKLGQLSEAERLLNSEYNPEWMMVNDFVASCL